MRRIYKWPLAETVISLPWFPGDRVLLVADQRGELMLWAEQEDDVYQGDRRFAVAGTGHQAPVGMEHVGSAVCGEFVWHVYADSVQLGADAERSFVQRTDDFERRVANAAEQLADLGRRMAAMEEKVAGIQEVNGLWDGS